jgi:SnoaL-like protein
MKIPLLSTLAGLVIGFAVPALAQDQNAVDPEVRQQIEAAHMKFYEAYNKHDATAVAALFTQDAVEFYHGWSEGWFGRRSGSD